MTIPVGFATFFLLPDTPHTTRAWYITGEEKELALERIRKACKAPPARITLATVKRTFGSWKWYAFVLGYVVSSFVMITDSFV